MLPVLCFLPGGAHAQYWGEQVLEKSFESTDFFFRPSHVNPYSLGGFGSAAVGLLSDPLLDVQINPAYLAADSLPGQYAYLDFRNSREIIERQVTPYFMDYVGRASFDYVAYPYYYTQTRTETAPVFSGAYLVQPRDFLEGLSLGATYQLVLQDQRYYTIPHDIYRNNPGRTFAADYAGSGQIPIVDRFSGSDGLQERGHFAALYSSVRVADGLDLGVRLGRTTFSRDGEVGSTNLWPSSPGRESLWRYSERRDQSYGHWDASAGLNYRLRPGLVVGLTGGYLWGDVTQDLAQQDSSFSRYATTYDDYSSTYLHGGSKDQHWLHEGSSYHGGINLLARVAPRTNLHAYYRRSAENVDIGLSSVLADTSFGSSHSEYAGESYEYLSHSAVSDLRAGFGEIEQTAHRAAVNLHWEIDRSTSVRLGGHVTSARRSVQTEESVVADRHTYYYSEGTHGTYEQSSATDEEKVLHWDFESESFSIQIPVFLSRRLSDVVELMFGVNRRIVGWQITDVTLAVFDYREEVENGTTEFRENFGERYRQPEERLTDTQTTLIGGLTITPADRFHIRLLMAPHFSQGWGGTTLREFQWWISLTATPGLHL